MFMVRFWWATDPERDEDGNPYEPAWQDHWPSGRPIAQDPVTLAGEIVGVSNGFPIDVDLGIGVKHQLVRSEAGLARVLEFRNVHIQADCTHPGCRQSLFEVEYFDD